ncbi:MAG: hypothetical protein EON60_13670 [Alphaproteobacteria bacterium]|nr:MAG: hypothetical protein EON60_13670 [Alphaproteobacteria bacterium]
MLNDVREEMICAMCIPDFVEMNRALVSTLHGACVVLVFVEGTTRTTAALRDQMAVFKDTLIRATVHALEPPMQDDCHAAFTAQLAHVG